MTTPEQRPSLHEIAAMPFPASVNAMRKYYDPNWDKEPNLDANGAPIIKWRVSVEYIYVCDGTFEDEVEASTEDEAEDIARELAEEECMGEDFEVISVTVSPVKGPVA